MPRRKRLTDDTVIAAATTVVVERDAEHTRLTDIAAVCGLAPATLIQRFGTRENLLDLVAASLARDVAAAFAEEGSSLAARIARAATRLDLVRGLRFLVHWRVSAAAFATELQKHIGLALMRAVEAGELSPCDVAGLARDIQIRILGVATAALLEGTLLEETQIGTVVHASVADYV